MTKNIFRRRGEDLDWEGEGNHSLMSSDHLDNFLIELSSQQFRLQDNRKNFEGEWYSILLLPNTYLHSLEFWMSNIAVALFKRNGGPQQVHFTSINQFLTLKKVHLCPSFGRDDLDFWLWLKSKQYIDGLTTSTYYIDCQMSK